MRPATALAAACLGAVACTGRTSADVDRRLTEAGRTYLLANAARIDRAATHVSKTAWLGRGALSTHPAFHAGNGPFMPSNIGLGRRVPSGSVGRGGSPRDRYRAGLRRQLGREPDSAEVTGYITLLNDKVRTLNTALRAQRDTLRELYGADRPQDAGLLIRKLIATHVLAMDSSTVGGRALEMPAAEERRIREAVVVTLLNRLGAASSLADTGGAR